MSFYRAVPLTVAALLLLLLGQPEAGAFAREAWEREGWLTRFEAGMENAQRTGRPAFVYFDAAWCSWCQQYKRDTLDRNEVRATLERLFTRIVVDFDARPDLMQRYGGKGLPFTVVLAPDGRTLARFVGVMTPPDLVDLLTALAERPVPLPEAAVTAAEVLYRVAALDRRNYEGFRRAFLEHLESLYDPVRHTLSGRFETGATLKRPSPLTWIYLMEHGLWTQRIERATRVDRERLWDAIDGGFFNFLDPSRGEYLESSKLLEANAWIGAWQAQAGVNDPEARRIAMLSWFYLRDVLWDRERGGFWQAQVADNDYYALPPRERLQRPPPPVEQAKRADTNAQTAWALLRMGLFTGEEEMIDYAAHTVDFLLAQMWREGRLYHIWRDGRLEGPDLPQSWFWMLAAGAEVERVRADRARRKQLNALAATARTWLRERMRGNTTGQPLDNELASLIAWTASQRDVYPRLPRGAREWALRQLRIETETAPDELVLGLMAWERALSGSNQ